MVGEGETAESVLAVESQDPLVRSAAQFLVDRFEGFDRIDGQQQLQFALNGKQQFLEVVPFQDDFGLDWLIVVVAPEADFLGQVNANTRTTALLSIAAVSAAVLLAILASRWITRPIMGVAQASEQMAAGNPPQTVDLTAISEMNTMATAFNTMSSRLHESFSGLRQSEAQNHALIAAIPDLLIRAQRDGTYIDILGTDRLQVHDPASFLVGTNVFASLPDEAASQRMAAIREALATGTLQLYEQQLSVDGQTYYEEVRVMVIDEDQVLIMVRDITNRKRAEVGLRIAEENYRSIYENALEGIFQSSVDGRFISVNPAMAEIYGYSTPQELMESIQDIRTQVYVDPADEQTFTTKLKEDGEVTGFEYRIYRRDGSVIWVRENSRAVVDDDGKILYYEGILQDITERKRVESDLRRQLEELQIEIDHSKRAQDVASITQSGYFQEIQAAVAEVNLEEFWQ
jgi:PAS domain S-box-containing protein